MRVKITKIFHFEMAHVLKGYDGPCKNIHGHSYQMDVTVSGLPLNDPSSPKNGMVIDFGDLKRLANEVVVDQFDHALVLSEGFDKELLSEKGRGDLKVITVDFQPTSENLVTHFANKIMAVLPGTVRLERIRLFETKSSYVEWCRMDQE